MTRPILKSMVRTGPDALPMEDDESTPSCVACGADHVGVVTPCMLMLRGSFGYNEQVGLELFFIDPKIAMEVIELSDGTYALCVDVNARRKKAMVMHEECWEEINERLANVSDVSPSEMWGEPDDETPKRY
jgi:hypothetical protein